MVDESSLVRSSTSFYHVSEIVKHAAVVTTNQNDRRRIVAVIESKDSRITTSFLQIWIGKIAPSFMIPWKIIVLKDREMPLTSSGKIDRVRVSKLLESKEIGIIVSTISEDSVVRRDNLTRIVSNVWKQVLNIKTLHMHDHFFRLGGDSLNSLRVCQLLRKRLTSFQFKSSVEKSLGELSGPFSVSELMKSSCV